MENNKLIYSVIFLLIVVVGAYFLLTRDKEDKRPFEERVASLGTVEMSFEGQIISISGEGEVVIKASRLEPGAEGNVVVEYDKVIKLAESVEIRADGETMSATPATFSSYVSVKDRAVFYGMGTVESLGEGEFTANRVDVLSRGTTDIELVFPE